MRKYLIIFYAAVLSFNLFPVYAETHKPQEFLQKISGSKNEGEQIYTHFCANCHAEKPVIPIGAPKIRNTKDWQWRLQQGMSILFEHTDEGLNAMPPRGGCFECSDKQLMLAIIFMLPEQDKKRPIK